MVDSIDETRYGTSGRSKGARVLVSDRVISAGQLCADLLYTDAAVPRAIWLALSSTQDGARFDLQGNIAHHVRIL